jgi:rhamnosyltransferase subunit B
LAHFLLTTFGSLGDLHPYIAVGIGLRDRGHRVTIATSEGYRAKIEGEGLNFHPVRPDMARLAQNPS